MVTSHRDRFMVEQSPSLACLHVRAAILPDEDGRSRVRQDRGCPYGQSGQNEMVGGRRRRVAAHGARERRPKVKAPHVGPTGGNHRSEEQDSGQY